MNKEDKSKEKNKGNGWLLLISDFLCVIFHLNNIVFFLCFFKITFLDIECFKTLNYTFLLFVSVFIIVIAVLRFQKKTFLNVLWSIIWVPFKLLFEILTKPFKIPTIIAWLQRRMKKIFRSLIFEIGLYFILVILLISLIYVKSVEFHLFVLVTLFIIFIPANILFLFYWTFYGPLGLVISVVKSISKIMGVYINFSMKDFSKKTPKDQKDFTESLTVLYQFLSSNKTKKRLIKLTNESNLALIFIVKYVLSFVTCAFLYGIIYFEINTFWPYSEQIGGISFMTMLYNSLQVIMGEGVSIFVNAYTIIKLLNIFEIITGMLYLTVLIVVFSLVTTSQYKRNREHIFAIIDVKINWIHKILKDQLNVNIGPKQIELIVDAEVVDENGELGKEKSDG